MAQLQPPQDGTPSPAARAQGWARALGASAAGVGGPALFWWAHPFLGAVFAAVELGIVVFIVWSAVRGSPDEREGTFRLLRMVFGRPEPRAPESPPARAARPKRP
ncbi:hypothetical protein AB0K21_43770 [Streptosporangium sp. NPDC049248]|uniref:hypothetical protein n=1 Tax=Streptosporangium sp. NPDC049248 TaxID=3155651 RepID=UPI00341A1CE8